MLFVVDSKGVFPNKEKNKIKHHVWLTTFSCLFVLCVLIYQHPVQHELFFPSNPNEIKQNHYPVRRTNLIATPFHRWPPPSFLTFCSVSSLQHPIRILYGTNQQQTRITNCSLQNTKHRSISQAFPSSKSKQAHWVLHFSQQQISPEWSSVTQQFRFAQQLLLLQKCTLGGQWDREK